LVTAALVACAVPPAVEAPKSADADDADLRSRAVGWEVLERNVGAGKIHDFQFGDYAIVSGEIGDRSAKTTRTHLALEKRRHVLTNYSFVLKGAGASTASVQATQSADVTWHTLLEFLPGLYIGPAGGGVEFSSNPEEEKSEQCWESEDDCWDDDEGHKRVMSAIDEQLLASIEVGDGVPASWQLSLDASRSRVLFELEVSSGSLSDGHRRIEIVPSTAYERTDGAPTWAYRFVEGGSTLAVLEFADRTQSLVWMRQELPTATQLALAAAMTAILQGQSTVPRH
jgi:hypothetical protein